jgi:hypothetical protein
LLLVITAALLAGCTQQPDTRAALGTESVPEAERSPLDAEEPDLLARVRSLQIDSTTNQITVYHSPEYREKAVHLQALVEDAIRFFTDSLDVRPELSLAVLTPEQWEGLITWQPYGMPGVAGEPAVAFLPATDVGLAADDALAIRPAVSPDAIRMIEASGHTFEDGARRYVDLVGLHELGHTYAAAYGIRAPTLWLNELVASYFAYAFMRAERPDRALLWDGILRGYIDAVKPDHRTLDAFDRLYFGVGGRNYVWYQARFQRQIQTIYDAEGLEFIRELRTAFPSTEQPRPPADSTLVRLERVSPGFQAWAASMH